MVYKLYLNKAVFFKAYIENYENITFREKKRKRQTDCTNTDCNVITKQHRLLINNNACYHTAIENTVLCK